MVDVADRALIPDVEAGETFHLIAPQVDPDTVVSRGREDIDYAAPHSELAPVFDLVLPPVPGVYKHPDEPIGVDLLPCTHANRLSVLDSRAEPLKQGSDRSDQKPRRR